MIDGISSAGGGIAVLAVDHRDSLRSVINPEDPSSVDRQAIVDLKRLVIEELADLATGVMLEPEYSIPELVSSLPAGCGFTAALESQGYSADPSSVPTELLDGWSVESAKRSGASMAKLLAYYSADAVDHAAQQEAIIATVVAECERLDVPLLLEPLAFPGQAEGGGAVAAVRATMPLGAHVMKVAWPGDAYLDELVNVLGDRPWVLLSGGVPFDVYLDQVKAAVSAGALGFAAGRAVWREVTQVPASEQRHVLQETCRPRLAALRSLVA